MAKKDVDLDNMSLDDFDFDIPEFTAEEDGSDARTPVNRAVKGAVSGLKNELASPNAIRKALTMALPEGYGLAADSLENIATDTRSLYDRIAGESPLLISGSKKFGRRAMGMIGNKVLPKKISDRINNSLEEIGRSDVSSDSDYRRQQEDSDLAALAEIFKAQTAGDMERDKQEAVEKVETKAMDQARFKSNIQALTAINRSMARLVGYQDKITVKYQQKMLELNYRQAATSKQLLDAFTINSQKQQAVLENIRKNTALPEAVKIRGSEMFGQMAKQKLMGNGLNTVNNWASNYSKQVMDNVSGMVQGIMSPIQMAQSMGGDDIDKVAVGGEAVGSMIGQEIRDRASMAISPLLAKHKGVARVNEKLRGIFTGLPQKVNEWSQTREKGTGYKAAGLQMLKDFLPKFMLDSRAGGDGLEDLDNVATFDKIARRSLIEIIPGYLSEIAHWSRIAVTGEKDSEKKVYNLVRGGFTSEKENLRDIGRQVLPRQEREALRSAAEDFIKEIGGDTLTSKAQRVLKRKLLDELANGRDLVPSRLVDREQYPGEDYETVDEIVSLIADTFAIDPETGKSINNSTDQIKRNNDINSSFHRMSSMIPAFGDKVRVFSDTAGKDVMRKLGYITRDKNGRSDRINQNALWDSVLDNEDDEPNSAGVPESKPSGPNRISDALDRMLGGTKMSAVLAGSADRADSNSAAAQTGGLRARGLERYLGDKGTLITVLKESREFHSETVELLRQLTNCGCGGSGGGGGGVSDVSKRMASYFDRLSSSASSNYTKGRDKVQSKYKELMPKFEELKKTGKDIWIQGTDHPLLQEAKLQAGEYYDEKSGDVIKKWEEIQGDVTDARGRVVARYDEIMSNGVFADYKGNVKGRVSKYLDKFKASRAGAATATIVADGVKRITSLGNKVNEIRGDGKLNTVADNVGNELDKLGAAGKAQLASAKGRFKPRLSKLMKFFSSGKTGADVTSELTGNSQEDMVTLALRSVQLQYETLKQVTTEKVRKGSMQDIWSRRKDIVKDGKDKVKGLHEDAQGFMGKSGMLKSLLAKFGIGDEEEGGDTNIDLGDSYGGGPEGESKRDRKTRQRRAGRTGKWGKLKNLGGRTLDKMGRFGQAAKFGAKAIGGLNSAAWWTTKMLGKGVMGAGRLLLGQGARSAALFAGRMALGAVLGAAGLVSAPVLAAVAIGGGALMIGNMIYGAMKDKLPLLARLRMIQYGVDPAPDNKQVLVLAEMEKLASKYVKVDNDGKAELDLAKIPIEVLSKVFGVELEEGSDPKENEHFMRMGRFVYGRFREVYLTHVSNYYVLTNSTDIGQVDAKVVGKAAVKFVNAVSMKGKEAILDDMTAPFADEDELEYDAGDVEDEYDDIKDDVIDEAKKADGTGPKTASQKQADAMKGSAVAAGGVVAAAAGSTATVKGRGHAIGTTGASGGGGGAGSVAKSLDGNKTSTTNLVGALGAGVAGAAGTSIIEAKMAAWNDASSEVDDGKAIRYRVYGLTEMLALRVFQLDTLEQGLFKMVSYDKDKQAQFKDMNAAYKFAESLFSPVGDTEAESTYVWFYRRFLPAFLTYCSGVRQRANIEAKEAPTKLDTNSLLEVLREVANAEDGAGISVWDITESPWKGYVLNTNMDSVKEPLYQLQLKLKDKPVQDPKVAQSGRVRGKNGEYEDTDPNQVNRPKTDGSSDSGSGKSEPGMLSKAGSAVADAAKSAVDKVKDWLGMGDDKAPQQGAVSANGQSVTPETAAAGSTTLPSGTPLNHPGGGTGGNINDIPQPKGDGWENSRDTLMAAANMVGVDPKLAASVAGVESAYKPGARPWSKKKQRYLSSAASYYQVIDDTWNYLMGKYAKKYGIAPGTRQTDPRANALLGLEYIRENIGEVSGSVGSRGVTDTDVYLAHFLGPGGARRFLKANPADAAINHVEANQASSNPSIFYNSKGQPRTVADVYRDFDTKLTKWRMGDASQVAASLKGGTPALETQDTEMVKMMGSDMVGPTQPTSMVKGADVSSSTNTVVDTSVTSTPVGTATEKADARQTQNTTAAMTVVAATADSQTSSQAQQQADNFGGTDKSLSRLIGINEAQLQQLVTMVTLLQGGQEAGAAQAKAATESSTTGGAVNRTIDTPRPAPRSTVSVGRT